MGNKPVSATAIGLGLETSTFNAKADEAAAKLRSMTTSFERDLSRSKTSTESFGKAAGGTFDLATRKIDGFGGALKGAQPAIAGMQRGLDLLGSKGPPALAGVMNAAVSLAATGFTPLGLAIGLASAAATLFMSRQTETTKVIDAQTTALKRQADAWNTLIERTDKAQLTARARGAGKDVDLTSIDERIGEVNFGINRERGIRSDIWASGDFAGAGPQRDRFQSYNRQVQLEAELARLAIQRAETMQRITAEAREHVSVTADLAYQQQRNDEVFRALHGGLSRADMDSSALRTSMGRHAADLLRRGPGASTASFLGGDRVRPEGIGPFPLPFDTSEAAMLPWQFRDPDPKILEQIEAAARARRAAGARGDDKWDFAQSGLPLAFGGKTNAGNAPALASAGEPWPRAAADVRLLTDNMSELERIGSLTGRTLAVGLGDSFVDSLDEAARGTEDFGVAFSSMTESVISDLSRIILKQYVVNALLAGATSIFGGGAPTAPSAPPAAGVPRAPWLTDPESTGAIQWGGARAHGGSYTVQGYGGVDSQLVAFKATPGERVDFTPPGGRSGGGTEVHVHNHSGHPAQQRRRRTPGGGERIDIIIGKMATAAIAADFARGGEAWQALERSAGARRVPRRG